jgi:phage tail-like protein
MSTRRHFFPVVSLAATVPIALAAAAALCLPQGARAAKEVFARSKPHVNVGVIGGDPLDLGGFQSVSGLGVEIEVLDDTTSVRKRPGRTKYSNITLKRGYVSNSELWDWAMAGVGGGDIPLRDLRIDLLTPSAEPIASFNLMSCFPTKWEVATDEGDQKQATETLVLSCDRVELTR